MTISLTKVAVLASAMLISASSVPALACGPEVAQFIASAGKVTPLANGACEFKIDIDLRKPQHQFSPMYTCPLDIDLLSSYPRLTILGRPNEVVVRPPIRHALLPSKKKFPRCRPSDETRSFRPWLQPWASCRPSDETRSFRPWLSPWIPHSPMTAL